MPSVQRPSSHRFRSFHPYTSMMIRPPSHSLFPTSSFFPTTSFFDDDDFFDFSMPTIMPEIMTLKNPMQLSENDDSFVVEMEVPGVQLKDINVEEKDGQVKVTAVRNNGKKSVQTYREIFYLPPNKVEVENLKATLNNGVLSVVVPKKTPKVLTIAPEVNTPPPAVNATKKISSGDDSAKDDSAMEEDTKKAEEYRFEMDLPGVDSSGLVVEADVAESQLSVNAKRQTAGGRTLTMNRSHQLPASVDLDKAHAYLYQGVLTVMVPYSATVENKEESEDGEKTGVRKFKVLTPDQEDGILPMVESMKLGNGEESSGDGKVAAKAAEATEKVA
eukprot:Nitzschia sp. Nitz4//scaffold87_size112219//12047//13039//NITZ4_004060-RA/size112219-processed-gene-0.122-mRNA-1//-1//CDS//3329559327//8914//frame0